MRVLVYFACFLLVVARTNGDAKLFLSDYKYDGAVKGWMKLHVVPDTWHNARLRCHYEGAVLASPLNQRILDVMKDIFNHENFEARLIHAGIHSTFSKGDFTSIEGIPLSKMQLTWAETTSSNNGILELKDCLRLRRTGCVETADCEDLLPYMCYKEDINDVKVSMCGPDEFGYKFSDRTGSCYKVHTNGRTWSRGYMTCLAEEAHLAIINSETEAMVVAELLKNYPPDSIFADYSHVFSVGYLDWGERGSWWTIHGETLDQAGYAIWENGGPDSKTQFCGGLNRSGKLNDIWCNNQTFPLVCEKRPSSNQPLF